MSRGCSPGVPGSSSSPVGFNPLGFTSYQNKALIADAVLSVLREIWTDSFGVRIQDILSRTSGGLVRAHFSTQDGA